MITAIEDKGQKWQITIPMRFNLFQRIIIRLLLNAEFKRVYLFGDTK